MALADYFHKSAIAAAQVLAGFDETAIQERLHGSDVGILLGKEASSCQEGRAATDLLVRLMARFYPKIVFQSAGDDTTRWAEQARTINPAIDIEEATPRIGVAIGADAPQASELTISLGSNKWDAFVSTAETLKVGDSPNPFGPGAAACIAAANLFRAVMIGADGPLDRGLVFSTLHLEPRPTTEVSPSEAALTADSVLVGLGAVGNGAAWALGRCSVAGRIHLVDPQEVELSNLQRYALLDRSSEGRVKVDVVAPYFDGPLVSETHATDWATFVEDHGYSWNRVLVAVDSARDRRAVQASLPRWIANSWTQPGDLGVSVHPEFREAGACLSCLYLPKGQSPSEDRLIARALGLGEQHELVIRQALHDNSPLPPELVKESAGSLGVAEEDFGVFRGRPLRELYSEGICGGAVLPLSRIGRPAEDVHVPLAHQSALAGVLLASRLAGDALGFGSLQSEATRLDLLRTVPPMPTRPVAKDERGICICQDPTYAEVYDLKYP